MATFKEETSQTELKLRVLPSALSKIAMLQNEVASFEELCHTVKGDLDDDPKVATGVQRYWNEYNAMEVFASKDADEEYDDEAARTDWIKQFKKDGPCISMAGPSTVYPQATPVYLGTDWAKYDWLTYAKDMNRMCRLLTNFFHTYKSVNETFKCLNGDHGWIQTKIKAAFKRQFLKEIMGMKTIFLFLNTDKVQDETYQPIALVNVIPAELKTTGDSDPAFTVDIAMSVDANGVPTTLKKSEKLT
eukprot:534857_1